MNHRDSDGSADEKAVQILKVDHDEQAFYRRSVLAAAIPTLQAAVVYFVAVTVYLGFNAPSEFFVPLMTQKFSYLAILLILLRKLQYGQVADKYAYPLITVILALCLTSMIGSALAGITTNLTSNFAILFLGSSLISLSLRRNFIYWAVFWISWATLSIPSWGDGNGSKQALALLGCQLVCLATSRIKITSAQRHYQMRISEIEQAKALEKALAEAQQARQQLDQQVEERTAQLRMAYEELRLSTQQREEIQRTSDTLQEQLLQAQKMESLGRLAGGVAHDFNNLLTVILGNLELAKSLPGDADQNDLLDQAEIAARRAAEVSCQLLAFSRKQVLSFRPVELSSVIQDSARLLQRLLGEDILLSVEIPANPLHVVADSCQLQQVLLNLGVNARDSMPQGGRLQIQLQNRSWKGVACAQLRIRDTGQGIEAEHLPRIFEPFFTTKAFGKGTGLGLSTVHGIVSQHGGEIEVASIMGQGSIFDIYLPLCEQSEKPEVSPRPLTSNPSKSTRLLLVEDDAQVRLLAQRTLQLCGYQVSVAENGEKALLLSNNAYDIVVTDIVMPGMDGASLAKEFSRIQPDCKVLFVSGYSDDRLAHFGVDSQDCHFLEKPYTPWGLCRKVESVLLV